jgi:hypothetical protein
MALFLGSDIHVYCHQILSICLRGAAAHLVRRREEEIESLRVERSLC